MVLKNKRACIEYDVQFVIRDTEWPKAQDHIFCAYRGTVMHPASLKTKHMAMMAYRQSWKGQSQNFYTHSGLKGQCEQNFQELHPELCSVSSLSQRRQRLWPVLQMRISEWSAVGSFAE